MKRIIAICHLVVISAFLVPAEHATGAANRLYLHLFTSGVCPHCRLAERELPVMLTRYPRITLVSYEVLNSRGQADAKNRQNMMKLISMLRQIHERQGGKPFIYEDKTPHAFALVNGVPYYLIKISESTTIKKEVPVPVFILGERVYVGYNPQALEQAIASLHNSGK